MEQCLFDQLILFVLETISSEDYLNNLGIYRPAKINWDRFKQQVARQTVKPGIYPRNVGRGSVHYYGVRQGLTKEVANGYKSLGGLDSRYAFGLDAQEDHSHGLCQTFALMFYCGEEDRLGRGRHEYFNNVLVGLRFLLDFIDADYYNREKVWTPNQILNTMTRVCKNHSNAEILNSIKLIGRTEIHLSNIIKFLLKPKYRQNLETWFTF